MHTTDRINNMIISGEIPEVVTAEIRCRRLHPNQFICLAASCGNAELVRDLLEMGASPNHRSHSGVPALLWAICSGEQECVNALLLAGADSSAMVDAPWVNWSINGYKYVPFEGTVRVIGFRLHGRNLCA